MGGRVPNLSERSPGISNRTTSEMRIFKEQLQIAIDILLQLTMKFFSPTNDTSTQEDHDYIFHRIFRTNPYFNQFCEVGEYEDIQDYSQSNLVKPNSVRCLFGVGEKK